MILIEAYLTKNFYKAQQADIKATLEQMLVTQDALDEMEDLELPVDFVAPENFGMLEGFADKLKEAKTDEVQQLWGRCFFANSLIGE